MNKEMALNPSPKFNPDSPIPNNPFYYPSSTLLQGPYHPVIITASSGLVINADGTITVTGGGGGGGISSLTVVSPLTNTGSFFSPVIGLQDATASHKGAVQIGSNFHISGSTISLLSASTSAAGVVQLNDTVGSTSTTEALTAAQGKNLQDQIDTLGNAGNLIFAGTFNASTSQLITVSSAGTAAGFTVGGNLPAPSFGNKNYFVIVTVNGSYNPPGGGGPYNVSQGDWFLSNGTSWKHLNSGTDAPTTTPGTSGYVELATDAETAAGVDTTRAVTPSSIASAYIPKQVLAGKGSIIAATAASTPAALSVGTDGQLLVANSAAPTGLAWVTPPDLGIPCACITAKGNLITGPAANTVTALPVGTNGQILTACSTASTGLCWTGGGSAVIPCSLITAKGSLIGGTAASTSAALPVGSDGQVLVACSSCVSGLTWATIPILTSATPTVAGIVLGCTTCLVTAIGCDVGDSGGAAAYFGRQAGQLSVGNCNTFIGRSSGTGGGVTYGPNNTALGTFSLAKFTSGCNNVAIGCGTGCNISVGNSNTLVGTRAGLNLIGGINNTLIGINAGCGASAIGNNNIVLGANSGLYLDVNQCCDILIGTNTGNVVGQPGCQIIIGNNTCAPLAGALYCCANIVIAPNECFTYGPLGYAALGYGGGGMLLFNLTTGIGWEYYSDARLKGNVTALPVKAEPFINDLRPVAFCFLNCQTEQFLQTKHCNVGFIAQEVERAMEDHGLGEITSLVKKPETEDDYYGLSDSSFKPLIVKALQEMFEKVSILEAKVAARGK